jgi:hypothetical protein
VRPRALTAKVRNYIDAWSLRRARYAPERNPKIVAILACIGINLAPTALGLQPVPTSLQEFAIYGQLSTGASAIGCFMCVAGQVVPRRWRDTGLAIEMGGTIFLAVGMLFYSVALFLFFDQSQRAYAFGASFGIGVGSLLRSGQIGLYVRGRRLADRKSHEQ